MKLSQLSVAILCIGMMTVACRKEHKFSDSEQQSANNEKADGNDAMNAFFQKNRSKKMETFTFNAAEGGTFVGQKGTVITVQAGGLQTLDGANYNGDVIMNLLEVQSVADAALFGFPTQTVWDATTQTGGDVLQTAGSLELVMKTPGGDQLTAQGSAVTIGVPIDATIGFDPAMTLWEGVPAPDQPRDNVWRGIPNQNFGENGAYYLFDWNGRQRCNVDRLFSCPGTPTPFRVDLPAGYNKTNTEIYIVAQVCGTPGAKSVFSMDVYNPSPIWWSEHTAAGIPIGTNVSFVAIANIGGQTYYKVENATIVANHFQHMTGMTPISLPALTAILNAL